MHGSAVGVQGLEAETLRRSEGAGSRGGDPARV
jgi:hypothetical protein